MSDFKAQAVKFRASVEKMSKDILESIDQSEVYNLINEDKYDEGDSSKFNSLRFKVTHFI